MQMMRSREQEGGPAHWVNGTDTQAFAESIPLAFLGYRDAEPGGRNAAASVECLLNE